MKVEIKSIIEEDQKVEENNPESELEKHFMVEMEILDGTDVVEHDTVNFAGTTTNDEILTYAENYLKAVERKPDKEIVKPININYKDIIGINFTCDNKPKP